MPRSRLPYLPQFRRQMVELVLTGRSPEELSREFEPTAQAIVRVETAERTGVPDWCQSSVSPGAFALASMSEHCSSRCSKGSSASSSMPSASILP